MDQAIYKKIEAQVSAGEKLYWVLLDPDDFAPDAAADIAAKSEANGADAILIGGSLLHTEYFDQFVTAVKEAITIPVILFPGDATQIAKSADAILFHTLISGRNPDFLIGEQLKGAPIIKKFGIEPISTAYMLIESGTVTSVEFMSNTRPIPREKPGITTLHGLAAQSLGQKLIYLEPGSGAKYSVPARVIGAVKSQVDIPVIVGGGIRDKETALEKLHAGADILVTGNVLNSPEGPERMKEIANTVKTFRNR